MRGQLIRIDRLRFQSPDLLFDLLAFRSFGCRAGQSGFQGGDLLPVRFPRLGILLDALIEESLLLDQFSPSVAQGRQATSERPFRPAQPDLATGDVRHAFHMPQEVLGGDCRRLRGVGRTKGCEAQNQRPDAGHPLKTANKAFLAESGQPILRSATSLSAGMRKPTHVRLNRRRRRNSPAVNSSRRRTPVDKTEGKFSG